MDHFKHKKIRRQEPYRDYGSPHALVYSDTCEQENPLVPDQTLCKPELQPGFACPKCRHLSGAMHYPDGEWICCHV